MKFIIFFLLILLAFSSYMAVTTQREVISEDPAASPTSPAAIPIPPAATLNLPTPTGNGYTIEITVGDPGGGNRHDDLEEEEDSGGSEDNGMSELKIETANSSLTQNFSIEQGIADVFGGETRTALAIAKAESGLNPNAINRNRNGTKDVGIFQINDCHGWSEEERLDPIKNIMMAKYLRDRNGWGKWEAYNNQTYRNYL